ncbi:DNA polymerase III subunit delta [Lederbergia sp. NSJ-179]|uniref:DNA polymerase III subunit delta n=1 Tax=Lederbergia sp. NSJ-179 TaxID=2931402 RepID=UPI001FD42702|nr:DNA polymerase III subunit delta [Lederbergia sp. NSJ-179]MCJ7841816.1 DNA polymerase III subunit delta [Lederbergia sp. NSJ-179]
MTMKIWNKLEKKQFSPLYLLYGTESYVINETKQKLVTNVLTNEEMDFNLSVYDVEETPIEQALEDAETLPFFGEKKLVILHNPIFLTSEKPKEKVEHNLKKLESYILEPAPYTILVFSGAYEKLDERKKITKLLKKHAEVVEGKKLNERELRVWVEQQAADQQVKMEKKAIDLLLNLVGPDLTRLHSELEKLFLYVGKERVVHVDTVEKLASRSLEQNIFDLIDKVVQRKMDEAFRIYYDLRKQNEEPIKILALIATQFRLIYQVKELIKRGYGQAQIASTLKVHPFRVKLATGQAHAFTDLELGAIIQLLAKTDQQLKTGGAGREVALELFLLQLGNLNKEG